jgi:threonine synthase
MSAPVIEKRTTIRDGAFGHARALVCRECGHEVELGPHYACPECFGPLEVGYDE